MLIIVYIIRSVFFTKKSPKHTQFNQIWSNMKMTLDAYRKVHWISSASISGDKCIKQANDVDENPGPTIFDIIDPTITVSALVL